MFPKTTASARIQCFLRFYSTLPRVISKESEAHKDVFSIVRFKQIYNPGMYFIKKVRLPDKWQEALEQVLKFENQKTLSAQADELCKYLRFRRLPLEEEDFKLKVAKVEDKILKKDTTIEQFLSEKELKSLKQKRENEARRELLSMIYDWEPLKFTRSLTLTYLAGRTTGEFAALSRVFSEIKKRDESFKPQTLFDYGSGVGSVLWAAHEFWESSLNEHLCIDVSRETSEVAELINKNGISTATPMIPNVYYRQFMPMSNDRKYDIVVSSYSLMEQSSAKLRIQMIDLLWKKTKRYLVIVEPGTNAGFQIINEARDYVLQLYKNPQESENDEIKEGHAFSPCPNDTYCPKKLKANEVSCNFMVKYRPLLPFHSDQTKYEVFSYVVLKKGPRNPHESHNWPRLVEDPIARSGHSICRLCTKEGTIVETVFTKRKHARGIFKCSRKAQRGDALPVTYQLTQKGDYKFLNNDMNDDSDEDDALSNPDLTCK